MKAPTYIKILGRAYMAAYRRNVLCIRKIPAGYRIFFNNNVVIAKDEAGKYFQQVHQTLAEAKRELSRYAEFRGAAHKRVIHTALNYKRFAKDLYARQEVER